MTAPLIRFDCPHCQERIEISVLPKLDADGNMIVLDRNGICTECGKGLRLLAGIHIETMSEDQVKQDSETNRIAKGVRKLYLSKKPPETPGG